MTDRASKIALMAAVLVLGPVALTYLAYSRPGYFSNQGYLGGLILLEVIAAAIWMYRRVFFPLVIVVFLLAGVSLHVGAVWTMARWLILGLGAVVGWIIALKDRGHYFGLFHALAFFAVLSALTSAAVSRYSGLSYLKVLSLLLLFLYAGTGTRLAVAGRENRFFAGLLLGCEMFVGIIGALFFLGVEVMGNPNSLGAVMGVVGAPVLLWGVLISQEPFTHHRRLLLYALAMYLTFASQARAGMVAAAFSCGLLCLSLRRYRLLAQGVGIILIVATSAAILRPEAFSRTISDLTATVVYKGKDPARGLLGSRQSPWQEAMDTIRSHFWFGTGFGTSDTGEDATADIGKFSSTSAVSTEHGSSYLAIASWVGMLGVLPFFMLLLLLSAKIAHTVLWMFRTEDPRHAAVPLAMVTMAGMIHAGFEDWMFAPGYYLCVFFWCIAFVLVDQAPSLAHNVRRFAPFWHDRTALPLLNEAAPNQ